MGLADSISYVTIAGDTFDIIALDFYNDEFRTADIIRANPQYAGVVSFDAGIVLKIPYMEESAPESLPPWKR